MHTARFLCNVYEEKYAINPYFSWNSEWQLAPEHCGIGYSVGYKANNVMRYVKRIEEDIVFYEEDTKIVFMVSDRVKIEDEIVEITDVVRNLDGSIDYYTNKVKYNPINTRKTFFDERPKEEEKPEKPKPPEPRMIYENFTGTEKEYNFWKRLFNKIKG